MKVFTYYNEVLGISFFDSLKLITAWRERWAASGYEPVVLNEYIARKHPFFAEFDKGLERLPTQNSRAYELACYHRWLALAHVGGGILADYDVFPRGVHGEMICEPTPNKLHLMQANCVCPCLSVSSADVALRVCKEFITREFQMHAINGQPHMSDQYALEQIVQAGADWIVQHDAVLLYTEPGWETRPFVHFANRVAQQQNKNPRWQFLGEVLA